MIDLFEDGATVVLQGLHRYWPPLTRLVAELELALGHPCQANAYLTPPGSQGFAVHSDTHDVFVFQTHGSKLWEVHPAPGDEGEARDVLLEPGLSMYLPTGTPHAARAQDTVSLHVTIGINQITWRTLLDRAVAPGHGRRRGAMRTCPPATSTIPTGSPTGWTARARPGRRARPHRRAPRSPTSRPARFLEKRGANLRGSLVDRMQLDAVTGDHRRCAAVPASRACCGPTATGCTCCSATAG